MISILIALVGISCFLILGEILWKTKILKGEYARKFVHITSASFVATWPLFLSHIAIAFISLLFIAVLIFTKKLKLFRSFRSVRRATYGETWYALGIGVSALLFADGAVFSVAILTMALADGLAAVVGVSLKQKAGVFKVYGHKKSFAGTLTFVIVAAIINYIYFHKYGANIVPATLAVPLFYGMISFANATILAVVELFSPKGSDNIIVPVMAGLLVLAPTLL
jgi:phytol kinase